jgi:hypothetical protein
MDGSFGFANTSNSVPVGRAKEAENSPQAKQPTDDDGIYEAQTQCDVDCLDVANISAHKLHVAGVRQEGEICSGAPDQEEDDIFEAETQCEVPSSTVPVRSFGASDPKKLQSAVRQDGDVPNEEAKAAGKSISSLRQECVETRDVNGRHETDRPPAKGTKHDDGPHSASTQSIAGDGSETSLKDKTDAVSVSSERTEEYAYDEASLSSHEDTDGRRSVQEKVDNKNVHVLTQRTAVCSERQTARAPSSNKDGEQTGQADREKMLRDVSDDEDSLDRSMLEGDEDLFAFELAQNTDSKEGTNKTTEKFDVIHQEDNSKSGNTNSDDPQTELTSLSKQRAVNQCKPVKMFSASGVSEERVSGKLKSHQARNGSVNVSDMFQATTENGVKSPPTSKKETAKPSNESGDKSDADGILGAAFENQEKLHGNKKDLRLCVQLSHDPGDEKRSEAKSPPVSNSKTVSKLFEPSARKDSSETSAIISSGNIKPETQSATGSGNAATRDRNGVKQNEVVECGNEGSRELAEPQDSSRQDASLTFAHKPTLISPERENLQTELSIECKDKNNSDNVDVFVAPTQTLFPVNKNRDCTNAATSSSVKVHAQLHSAHEDDDIFEMQTQIVETPNRSGEDVTEPFARSSVEEKLNADHDDNIYEAATQIVEAPIKNSKDSKDFAERFTSYPAGDKRDAELDGSDSICEAATQIVGTRIKSSKDFAERFTSYPARDKTDAELDGSDSMFEAATQIVEAPIKSSKDSKNVAEHSAPSTVKGKINTGHDDDDDDDIYEVATQIMEASNKNSKDSKDFAGPFTSSPVGDKTDEECGNEDFIFEAATQIMETAIRKPGLAESKRQKLSPGDKEGETGTTESKKLFDALTCIQGGDEKSVMTKSLKAGEGAICAQKAEEAHDTAMRAQRSGNGKPGVEGLKKLDVPVVGPQKENAATERKAEPAAGSTHRDRDELCGMEEAETADDNATSGQRHVSGEPVIPDSKKPSDTLNARKERDQEPEMAGSEVQDGPRLSPHEDSGDETDPEHVFEADSHKIKMERNPDRPSAVQVSTLPSSSVETARKVGEGEVICIEDKQPSSPSLILPEETVVSSVGSTEDKKGSTRIAESVDTAVPVHSARISTKPVSADMSLAAGSSDSGDVVAVQPVTKVTESVSESCLVTTAVASPLPQDRSADNGDRSLQEGAPTDHMKDTDRAEKIPSISIRTEVLEPKYPNIQKETDPKLYADVDRKMPLENDRPFFDKADGIVDEPAKDSLNDTHDLIMPTSQELRKAVKQSEERESPFRPEELVPSEEEEPDPSLEVGGRCHVPSRRVKVRKRLNVDCGRSDTAVGAGSRRRTLPSGGIVQNEASDIAVRASKQRKLSARGSVQNGGRNVATGVTSRSSADRPDGEILQTEAEHTAKAEEANVGRGRKSRIVAAENKGQGKTVPSTELQKGVDVKPSLEGFRADRSSRSKVGKTEQDLSLGRCDTPRGGRSSLSKRVAESTGGGDCSEARESGGERSADENTDAQSSRPSRRRKITWKIQDGLKANSSEENVRPEETTKNRRRGRASNNSQSEVSRDVTVRSRNASFSKSAPNKLVESSEDTGEEVKNAEGDPVPRQQNVTVRRPTRQSKGGRSVTSATDPSQIRSPQRTTRQKDRQDSSDVRKWRTEETLAEPSSKRSKRDSKFFPVGKSQRSSADRGSPKSSRSVLSSDECLEGVSEGTRAAWGRKETDTATRVALIQEQSSCVSNVNSVVTVNKRQAGSVQGRTRRSGRGRPEDTDTSPSCLKDLNMPESLNASHRTQRGVKRTKPNAEEVYEHSPPKQLRSEKSLCEALPHESIEPRRGRTRGKVASPQKQEATGMVKQETTGMAKQEAKSGQRERTRRAAKREESDKSVTTPGSRKTNLSGEQDAAPKVTRPSRARGTPQGSREPSSQKVSVADATVCKRLRGSDSCKNKLGT